MALDLSDKTANGNDLTNNSVSEETTDVPSGLSGATNAASFDSASTSYFSRASASLTNLDFSTTFTLEFWAKWSNDASHQAFAARWTTNVNWLIYYRSGDNQLRLDMFDTNGSTRDVIYWSPTGATGAWHHFAFTVDASNASATTAEYFLDGTSKGNGTVSVGGNVSTIRSAESPLEIGAISGAAGFEYNGLMKDVRFWNDVRTQTEIDNNKGSFLAGNETGLVAYYPFETISSNTNPNTPSITSPSNSATGTSTTLTMTSSSFSDDDVGDTHANSQWLISDDSGFTSTEWDSGSDASNLTSIAVTDSNGTFGGTLAGENTLTANTTYYAKVRHQDNNSGWSDYSSAISFTTTPVNVHAFGDSVTNGNGTSGANYTWEALHAENKGWDWSESADGGADSSDNLGTIYAKTSITTNDRSAWLAGYNDMRYYGTNVGALTSYQDNVYAGLAWLAIPSANKITGQGGATTESGTWSNSDVFTGIGRKSSTQNDTVEFTASGTVIYVAYTKLVTGTGEFSVTVDGINKGTFNCYGATTSPSGNTYSGGLARITGLTSGSHAVVITVTSSSGTVYFDWGAGNGTAGVPVRIGPPLYMNATGYAAGTPYNNGSDDAVLDYRQKTYLAALDLSGDGLNVQTIDVNNYYDPDTETADNIHPNDAGHINIATSFNEDLEDTPNVAPDTPSITSPSDTATSVSVNPTVTSSAFSDSNVGATHQASQWLISDDSGFVSTEWDSGTDTTNKTSIVVNSSNGTFGGALAGETRLAYETQYWVKVRHQDENNIWSNYSTAISFTTGSAPVPGKADSSGQKLSLNTLSM